MFFPISLVMIGSILFGRDTDIKEGTKVTRTGKKAGVPVGNKYVGRVVNALGAPIDGKGEIEADDYRPIEQEAPGIIDRKSVSVPMETGILSIDAMFPIGRRFRSAGGDGYQFRLCANPHRHRRPIRPGNHSGRGAGGRMRCHPLRHFPTITVIR